MMRNKGGKLKKRTKEEELGKVRWSIREMPLTVVKVCVVIRYCFVEVRTDKTFKI